MSKFLKFIVGLALTLFILSGAALLLPAYLGFNTTIIDRATEGNQALGNVIYTVQIPLAEVKEGDRILELRGDMANVRTVDSFDSETETLHYQDGEENRVKENGSFYKVRFVLPILGYLSIAMQSRNGMIFLGLILLLIIFLFILAEVLRMHKEDMEDLEAYDEEDDDSYFEDLTATHRMQMDREDVERGKGRSKKPRRSSDDHKEKKEKKEKKAKRSKKSDQGQEAQERAEDHEPAIDTGALEKALESRLSANGAPKETPQTSAGADRDHSSESTNSTTPEDMASGESLGGQTRIFRKNSSQEDQEKTENKNRDEVTIALPALSAEQLLQKAYQDGLDPKVIEDESTGVTLIDYSDSL